MNVCFVLIVFQSDWVLDACLEAVRPFGRIVAAEGPVKYWQDRGFTTSTDRTNEILNAFGVQTIHGQWQEKDEEAQAAFSLVRDDTDIVWMIDADEVWEASVVECVLQCFEDSPIGTMAFSPYSFYGGFERYMTGFEENFEWRRVFRWAPGAKLLTHRPPTVVGANGESLGMAWGNRMTRAGDMRFYHYSYLFPEQIRAKTDYYHSWSKTIPGYFRRVYMPWVTGNDDQKQAIENAFDGVHDWLPAWRGECRTRPFTGEHPTVIRGRLPQLRERFERELEKYQ